MSEARQVEHVLLDEQPAPSRPNPFLIRIWDEARQGDVRPRPVLAQPRPSSVRKVLVFDKD
jgi:hypothetical protein